MEEGVIKRSEPYAALAGEPRLVGALSHDWKVAGSILDWGTCLGCRFDPQSRRVWETASWYFSFELVFLSLPLSRGDKKKCPRMGIIKTQTYAHTWGGTSPENWNYLMEGRPLVGQVFPTRWLFWETICITAPAGIVVRGCIQLQCPLHDGWFMSIPVHTTLSVQQYLTKNGMTTMPSHPVYSPHLPWVTFFLFVSQLKKVLKGNLFATAEEVKQNKQKKWQKHERHQNQRVQKPVLSNGKNISIGVLHQMESTLKVTEV